MIEHDKQDPNNDSIGVIVAVNNGHDDLIGDISQVCQGARGLKGASVGAAHGLEVRGGIRDSARKANVV